MNDWEYFKRYEILFRAGKSKDYRYFRRKDNRLESYFTDGGWKVSHRPIVLSRDIVISEDEFLLESIK